MGDDLTDSVLIRSYLLRDLGEEDAERVEMRLMADDDFARAVDLAEEELIDDYVEGELAQSDREKFERAFFSSPERRQQVTFAFALRKYVSENQNRALHSVSESWPSEDAANLVISSTLAESQVEPGSAAPGLASAARPRREGNKGFESRSFAAWLRRPGMAARLAIAACVAVLIAAACLLCLRRVLYHDSNSYRVSRTGNSKPEVNGPSISTPGTNGGPEQQARTPDQIAAGRPPDSGSPKAGPEAASTPGGKRVDSQGEAVLAVTLSPDLLARGDGSIRVLHVAGRALHLKLILPPGAGFEGYTALLRLNGGGDFRVPGTLRSESPDREGHRRFVMLSLPPGSLNYGDYRLILSGSKTVKETAPSPQNVDSQASQSAQNVGDSSIAVPVATYNFRASNK